MSVCAFATHPDLSIIITPTHRAHLIRFSFRHPRPKYGITEQRSGYKGTMRLTVRAFSSADVGTYHCVSTNSLGRAEGTLRLYGKYFLFHNGWMGGMRFMPDGALGLIMYPASPPTRM